MEKYIPIFVKENTLKFYTENNSNKSELVSKRFPELKTLEINKVSTFILELADGSNSIKDISEKIIESYNNVPYEKINDDILKFLETCYRLDLIKWKDNNPFLKKYINNDKGLTCEILSPVQASNILNEIRKEKGVYESISFKKNLYESNEIVEKRSFYYQSCYCVIKHNERNILFYEIELKTLKQQSFNINIYYIASIDIKDIKDIKEFIGWTIKEYSKIIKHNINRVDCNTIEKYKEIIDFIEKIGFKKIGTLKKHISIDEMIYDIQVYSHDI